MSNKQYSKLLNHPKWQKRRLEILSRDNWKCKICGFGLETEPDDSEEPNKLEVHHSSYHGKPWDAPDSALHTICSGCHEYLTQKEIDFHDAKKHGDVLFGLVLNIGVVNRKNNVHYLSIYQFNAFKRKDGFTPDDEIIAGIHSGKSFDVLRFGDVPLHAYNNAILITKNKNIRVGKSAWNLMKKLLPEKTE